MSWQGANVLLHQTKRRRAKGGDRQQNDGYIMSAAEDEDRQQYTMLESSGGQDGRSSVAMMEDSAHSRRSRTGDNHAALHHPKQRPMRRSMPTETVEAALNRLSKAYSAAMECVGALHRADQAASGEFNSASLSSSLVVATTSASSDVRYQSASALSNPRQQKHQQQQSTTNVMTIMDADKDSRSVLCNVARTARQTFEEAILQDPLVAYEHAQQWYSTTRWLLAEEQQQESDDRSFLRSRPVSWTMRPSSVILRSAGHKATVKQLAYLSLVNYADLLLAGCLRRQTNATSKNDPLTLLDRGFVPNLHVVKQQQDTCWLRKEPSLVQKQCSDPSLVDRRHELNRKPLDPNNGVVVLTGQPSGSALTGPRDKNDSSSLVLADQSSTLSQGDGATVTAQDSLSPDHQQITVASKAPADADATLESQSETLVVDNPNALLPHIDEQSKTLIPSASEQGKKSPTTPAKLATSTSLTRSAESHPEPEWITVRLALVAYLDATKLDGSDPTVWLKLAAAARRLGRVVAVEVGSEQQPTSAPFLRYRRLEKYALEQAFLALPRNVPNRLAFQALREWQAEDEKLTEYPAHLASEMEEDLGPAVLELPRYSWSTLGRILLRACKEGVRAPTSAPSTLPSPSAPVRVQLSPLLVLPVSVLAHVCQFLESQQLWGVEATCRALSSSVLAARAALDQDASRRQQQAEEAATSQNASISMGQRLSPQFARTKDDQARKGSLRSPRASNMSTMKASSPVVDTLCSRQLDEGSAEVVSGSIGLQATGSDKNRCAASPTAMQASRVSKRLRSQIITSGKRAERNNRRNSLAYCLLACTLHCAPEDKQYTDFITMECDWGGILGHVEDNDESHVGTRQLQEKGKVRTQPPHAAHDKVSRAKEDAVERMSDSSVWGFLKNMDGKPTTPYDMLFGFLAHASMHIAEVFASDQGGSIALCSCLLDSFDLLARRTKLNEKLVPSWSSSSIEFSRNGVHTKMELIAMDLLRAELRFKRCDGEALVDTDFDSDANFVSMMVPCLIRTIDEMDGKSDWKPVSERCWAAITARSNWLAAGYFFWRSRISQDIWESREAEREGLRFVGFTLESLVLPDPMSIQQIPTPHLGSPTRNGSHWKELSASSLQAFRNEIQASSVILSARERFVKVASGVPSDQAIHEEDKESLKSIGAALLGRYSLETEASRSKHVELIDDFLTVHRERLLVQEGDDVERAETSRQSWFDQILPVEAITTAETLQRMQHPCILTILMVCLQTMENIQLKIVHLLEHLVSLIAELLEDSPARLNSERRQDSGVHDDDYSDSDDDIMTDDGADGIAAGSAMAFEVVKTRRLAQMACVFVMKIRFAMANMSREDRDVILESKLCSRLIQNAIRCCHYYYSAFDQLETAENVKSGDLELFQSIKSFFEDIVLYVGSEQAMDLTSIYWVNSVRLLCIQRRNILYLVNKKVDRRERSSIQRLAKKRAILVACICCETGVLLANNLATTTTFSISRSWLVSGQREEVMLHLCSCLVWFWKVVILETIPAESRSERCNHLYLNPPGVGLAKAMGEYLRVALATAIVGLCGAGVSTFRTSSIGAFINKVAPGDEHLSLVDFYDSDASSMDWLAEEGPEKINEDGRKREELLRVITQCVHCVGHAFSAVGDAEAASFSYVDGYITSKGPMLPLVVSRVLNNLVDRLLIDFGGNPDKGESFGSIWTEFPQGTRTTGRLLDSMLHKAYKYLHGFSLGHASESKDPANSDAVASRIFPPESPVAGAKLYRWIMRSYPLGRKTPPKSSVDKVLEALPPAAESPKRILVNNYLFAADQEHLDLDGLCSLVSKDNDWEARFSQSNQNFWNDLTQCSLETDKTQDELSIVRRGIAHIVAQGPIPQYQDGGADHDERTASTTAEVELARKFFAILDDLCYGDVTNFAGWCKAAQCLLVKAEIVSDRLGLAKGFARNKNFFVPKSSSEDGSIGLTELTADQEHENSVRVEGWAQSLGGTLEHFVRHSWSSFDSLLTLARKTKSFYVDRTLQSTVQVGACDFETCVWLTIDNLYRQGDYVAWQQAWGGLFVSGLRKTAFRCLQFALCIVYKRETSQSDSLLISEICESLGVSLYSELMGSQLYGYPMQKMPLHRKRGIALTALSCFRRACEAAGQPETDEASEGGRVTWDLKFMMGKCCEKVAKTYWLEAFQTAIEGDLPFIRRYEHYMKQALEFYSRSLSEATELSKEGGLITEQSGGSAHGSVEVVYRLHASRLACLIAAVTRKHDEKNDAEREALRVTECHWYSKQADDLDQLSIRERVWNVLVDVVAALKQCRLDHPFFHRSVYRCAQAFMWAPILYDPIGERLNGSLGTVPSTWSFKLRGLNYSTNAASSAVAVISSLFEKKRPQLCAVWVTNGSGSAFQTLNNSVRKYDSLRGKYIAAYIDSLRLCQRQNELETFLRWVSTCKRDLPSFFAASAEAEGKKPLHPHTHDSLLVTKGSLSSWFLLTTVKRKANSALASVVLEKLKDSQEEKALENIAKSAYACFLRLNTPIEEFKKGQRWRIYDPNAGAKEVVNALTSSYLMLTKDEPVSVEYQGDWSGASQVTNLLQQALRKCKELFPTLSGGFFFNKVVAKSKKKKDDRAGDMRKEPQGEQEEEDHAPTATTATVSQSFEVAIPEGLAAGDTFVTSIRLQDRIKKVRLTVPKNARTTLRFSLQVPRSERGGDEPSTKEAKTTESC